MTGSTRWWWGGRRLYLLPFDHRGSFNKDLFAMTGDHEPDQDQGARIVDLKALICERLEQALVEGAPRGAASVLRGPHRGSTPWSTVSPAVPPVKRPTDLDRREVREMIDVYEHGTSTSTRRPATVYPRNTSSVNETVTIDA